MERMILCYVLLINILCFLLMGEDKRRARGGKYRIAEKHLFLAAALGGAFGGTPGMSGQAVPGVWSREIRMP